MASKPTVAPTLFTLQNIADSIQVSKRTVNRMRKSGVLPAADFAYGTKTPRWFQKTIAEWIASGCALEPASSRKTATPASN